ncbi:hypothetical protein HPB49_005648 [Dermacentor silvarum]|uniref:Uncharacterized protein n=1 Tax=Dermacentor silvarum TaxID=543639 RepID=A0ACB8CJP5_DERSI|nr:hypothetical protein HPB49_005648 [Dermacentor silvarum]
MDALRRWRPAVKGATPTAPADDPTAGGRHERAMMVALLVNMSAGTALGYASVSMPRIELESWYNLQPQAHVNQSVADILLLGAAAGALFSEGKALTRTHVHTDTDGTFLEEEDEKERMHTRSLTVPLAERIQHCEAYRKTSGRRAGRGEGGQLLHLLGTRITLLLSAFGQINSWICVVVSNNVTMLFIGRVTCGIWLGVSANSVSLYICDVAPPTKRTFFGALTEVALSLGMLAAYVLGGVGWQILAIVFTVAPVSVFVLHNYIIESPRWFVIKGRYRDSNTAMVRLYGDDVPTDFRYSRSGDDSNVATVGRQKVAR